MTKRQAEALRTAAIDAAWREARAIEEYLDTLRAAKIQAVWDWFDSGAYRRKGGERPPTGEDLRRRFGVPEGEP